MISARCSVCARVGCERVDGWWTGSSWHDGVVGGMEVKEGEQVRRRRQRARSTTSGLFLSWLVAQQQLLAEQAAARLQSGLATAARPSVVHTTSSGVLHQAAIREACSVHITICLDAEGEGGQALNAQGSESKMPSPPCPAALSALHLTPSRSRPGRLEDASMVDSWRRSLALLATLAGANQPRSISLLCRCRCPVG